MEIVKLKDEQTEVSAKITIPTKIIDHTIEHKLVDLAKKIKLPGFRPGKVPLSIVKKKYNDSVRTEAIEDKINEVINNFIKENKLNIIGSPILENVNDKSDKGLEFVFTCYKVPPIELPDFTQIELEKPVLKLSIEDIEEGLQELAENFYDYKNERKGNILSGDKLIINADATVDGKDFVEGKLEQVPLVLGKGTTMNKLFEEKLLGHKIGDVINVDVVLPQNYKKLSGKIANFNVTIIEAYEPKKATINDDFAKQFNYQTIDELKEFISQNLEKQYKQHINLTMKMHLFNKIDKISNIEIPKVLLDKEISILKSQMEPVVQEEEILKNKTSEELEKYYNKLAIRRIKIGLILAKYVEDKNLKITNNDIQNAIIDQANSYPGQERQIIEFYTKNPKAVENLRGPILEDLAVNDLFNNNIIKLTDKEYTKKQLDEFLTTEVDYELN